MDREEVRDIAKGIILPFHGDNLVRMELFAAALEALKQRIIGIDGNGTGKIGVLQKQDIVLAELKQNQKVIEKKLDDLSISLNTWSKARFWHNLRWLLVVLVTLLGVLISYMAYRTIAHPSAPLAIHATNGSTQTDASN